MKKIVLLLAGLICAATGFAGDNPKAKEEATVVFGKARFTVLAPELIRMEYDDNAVFEDRASLVFINRETDVPAFKQKRSGKNLTLTTDKLTLKYTDNGKPFDADNLSIAISSAWHGPEIIAICSNGTPYSL